MDAALDASEPEHASPFQHAAQLSFKSISVETESC